MKVSDPNIPKEVVGQFYFPLGKPISTKEQKESQEAIDKIFEGKAELKIVEDDFSTVCTDVCKIPKIFQKALFEAIKKEEKLRKHVAANQNLFQG